MLLHLPIGIMVALSPTAVSDSVPQFDIVKESAGHDVCFLSSA